MNIKDKAKILLELAFDSENRLSLDRVKALCSFVENQIPQIEKLKLLKEFLHLVKLSIEKDKASVFYAGSLSQSGRAELENFVKKANPNSMPVFGKDDSLIGGVRIEVGDFVWENSIKMKLDDLAKSFK